MTAASQPPPAFSLSPRYQNPFTVSTLSHNFSIESIVPSVVPLHLEQTKCVGNLAITLYFCTFAMNPVSKFRAQQQIAHYSPSTNFSWIYLAFLNSSTSEPLTITFVFLMLTFKLSLSNASFEFQNLSF